MNKRGKKKQQPAQQRHHCHPQQVVLISCIGGKRGCATWVKSTSAMNGAVTYDLGHIIIILEVFVSVGPDGLTNLNI